MQRWFDIHGDQFLDYEWDLFVRKLDSYWFLAVISINNGFRDLTCWPHVITKLLRWSSTSTCGLVYVRSSQLTGPRPQWAVAPEITYMSSRCYSNSKSQTASFEISRGRKVKPLADILKTILYNTFVIMIPLPCWARNWLSITEITLQNKIQYIKMWTGEKFLSNLYIE